MAYSALMANTAMKQAVSDTICSSYRTILASIPNGDCKNEFRPGSVVVDTTLLVVSHVDAGELSVVVSESASALSTSVTSSLKSISDIDSVTTASLSVTADSISAALDIPGYSSSGVSAGLPWPNGRVPFCFAPDVSENVKQVFAAAVRQYTLALPCLDFINVGHESGNSTSPHHGLQREDSSIVRPMCKESNAVFVKGDPNEGCLSMVGLIRQWGSQPLQLGPGCVHVGTILHEIGHTLGMGHEHQRGDRDKSIKVHLDNVRSGEENWFDTRSGYHVALPYDTLSIMHYGAFAFANDTSQPTIEHIGGGHEGIGNRMGLANSDIEQLLQMYRPEVPECAGNARAGIGCVDMQTDTGEQKCSGITKCDEESQKLCCACHGGITVQCYKGGVCHNPEKLTGPEHPYQGYTYNDGTLGSWEKRNISYALQLCAEKEDCVGITMAQEFDNQPQPADKEVWLSYKSHFRLGGYTANPGWSSYRIPEVVSTSSGTPAATATMREQNATFLASGGEILHLGTLGDGWDRTTVELAKQKCLADIECKSFQVSGSTAGEAWIMYKNHRLSGPSAEWTSYFKE